MAGALVGVDLGTSSVKVVAVDADGGVLATASRGYPTLHPEPGAAEQDPEAWWAAVVAALQEVTAVVSDVAAVGLTGQMHGTVLSFEPGIEVPDFPAIIWADTRSGRQAASIEREIGRDRLASLTGTAIAAGFQAATLRWIRETLPDVLPLTRHVLLPKDEIRQRLTGREVTDPSDAAGTGLLDLTTRTWSLEMLAAAGVKSYSMPEIIGSAEAEGREGRDYSVAHWAEVTGLKEGTPVVGGGGDAPVGAIAAGVVEEGDLLLSLSSGAQVIAPVREPRVDPALRVHTFASALDPGAGEPGWNVMGATMAAGSAVRWLRDAVFGLTGDDALAEMEATAASVPPGADGLIFLPYLSGERTPHLDPDARGVFLGLSAEHGRGHLVRAVMEGSIFALADAYGVVRELVPEPPRRVVLAGGGSRSAVWRQIVADVFDLPILPLTVGEQSAMGAAMLAAAYDARVPVSEIARAWVRLDPPIDPIPANVVCYREILAIYRDLYPLHREHFQALARLRGRP